MPDKEDPLTRLYAAASVPSLKSRLKKAAERNFELENSLLTYLLHSDNRSKGFAPFVAGVTNVAVNAYMQLTRDGRAETPPAKLIERMLHKSDAAADSPQEVRTLMTSVSQYLLPKGAADAATPERIARDAFAAAMTLQAPLKDHDLRVALRPLEDKFGFVHPIDPSPHPLRIRVSNAREANRLGLFAKEALTVRWVQENITPESVFFDIGANIGGFSLLAAAHAKCRVIALEPFLPNAAAIPVNAHLNELDGNIVTLPMAASATTELSNFSLSSIDAGSALHQLGGTADLDKPADESDGLNVPVLAMRLDDIIAMFRLPPPTHIKIDVDGSEESVLLGAQKTLASGSIKSLIIEVDNTDEMTAKVVAQLTPHGYCETENAPTLGGKAIYRIYEKS